MGADVFKIATRTDMPAQLTRLLEFVEQQDAEMSIAAMGIGKLGAVSRVALAQSGSSLIYASIGRRRVEGQLSLDHLRAALDASGNVPFAPVSFAKEYARLLRSEDRR
jgi:3-dehydroquinate dehydratase